MAEKVGRLLLISQSERMDCLIRSTQKEHPSKLFLTRLYGFFSQVLNGKEQKGA
ncbi:hypothetical protein D3C72_2284750 [compost metagenome]